MAARPLNPKSHRWNEPMRTSRVDDRRRHARNPYTAATLLRDRSGHIVMRGRTADICPGGVKVVGRAGKDLKEGMFVWVELKVPSARASSGGRRVVKVSGEVRRVGIMGSWRTALVVVFESDFSQRMLDPTL